MIKQILRTGLLLLVIFGIIIGIFSAIAGGTSMFAKYPESSLKSVESLVGEWVKIEDKNSMRTLEKIVIRQDGTGYRQHKDGRRQKIYKTKISNGRLGIRVEGGHYLQYFGKIQEDNQLVLQEKTDTTQMVFKKTL